MPDLFYFASSSADAAHDGLDFIEMMLQSSV
jgi:hypothetical protein